MTRATFLTLILGASLYAAVPPAVKYVSPEVHSDGKVTFRVAGPKAAEVKLFGGWMAADKSVDLAKGADGVWSATVGPLAPTVYAYWFTIDGSVVLDQANQYVRSRKEGSSVSMVEVPGTADAWSTRSVPHGTVEISTAKSETFGDTREIRVYLPPGYEKNASAKYPVLYLLHGAGEMESAWTVSGKANLILDNLLADGKIRPMIVVMPHTLPPGNVPAPPPPAAGGRGAGPNPATLLKPVDYVVKEVMPWSEGKYRIAAGRKNRAVAGFSMGGMLTASIGFAHLDLFSHMGIFSAGVANFGTRFPEIAGNAKATNEKLDVLWMGVGKLDAGPLEGLRSLDADLTKAGVRHTYMETDGAHDYQVWRWCLTQYAPLLFKSGVQSH